MIRVVIFIYGSSPQQPFVNLPPPPPPGGLIPSIADRCLARLWRGLLDKYTCFFLRGAIGASETEGVCTILVYLTVTVIKLSIFRYLPVRYRTVRYHVLCTLASGTPISQLPAIPANENHPEDWSTAWRAATHERKIWLHAFLARCFLLLS